MTKAEADARFPAHLVVKSFTSLEMKPVHWLMNGRIPFGELTIVEGDGDIGKTTTMLNLAARFSRGRPMPDGTNAGHGRVLVIAEEDRADLNRARLIASDADLTKIDLVLGVETVFETSFLTLPDHGDALVRAIRNGDYGIVFMDSLLGHFGDKMDSTKAQDARQLLRPLIDGSHQTDAAIIANRHWTKSAGKASARGLGSIDLRNQVRSVLTVGPHPADDGRFVIASSKSNLSKPVKALTYRLASVDVDGFGEVARVEWGDDVDISADTLANNQLQTNEESGAAGACADYLENLLSAGSLPCEEVYAEGDKRGFSRSMVYRTSVKMGIRKPRHGFPKRTTWQLASSPGSRSLHTRTEVTDATEETQEEEVEVSL